MKQKSRDELHNYWRKPSDVGNFPNAYIKPIQRSRFLYNCISKYSDNNAKILELGCNVGRNLNYLFEAGYKHLTAIEISENAIKTLKETYPKMARELDIYHSTIEDAITKFNKGQFHIVYTMAVLEHIHTDSEWIFREIARITKSYLITIEDESSISDRHFPRNYKNIFEPLGFVQVQENLCLESGLGGSFRLRVFRKKN